MFDIKCWGYTKSLKYLINLCGQVVFFNTIYINDVYATASWDDTFKPYVAVNLLYDSNLLRLSDDTPLPKGKSSKSDFIKRVNAGVDIDWTAGQQQFLINADINNSWFQNFDELNYFGWGIGAQWNWQIGSNWKSTVGYSNIKALGSFDQLNRLVPNVYNFAKYDVNLGYDFHPSGRIRIGYFRTESKQDSEERKVGNLTENNAELNLEYISPTGSMLGMRILATIGEYPNQNLNFDQSFVRMDYAVIYDWVWSIKTRIHGRIGYTQQNYDFIPNKDFSGFTGVLFADWAATEKIFISFSAWREIRQVDDIFSTFNLSQGVQLLPSWEVTPKVKMSLSMSYIQEDYQGILGGDSSSELRQDEIGRFKYNLIYKPFENIIFDALFGYEKKNSNREFRSYNDYSTGLNIKVIF